MTAVAIVISNNDNSEKQENGKAGHAEAFPSRDGPRVYFCL